RCLSRARRRQDLGTRVLSCRGLVGQHDLHAPGSGLADDLVGPREGGELLGNSLQRGGASLLSRLTLLPGVVQVHWYFSGCKDVGMSGYEFVGDTPRNVLHSKAARLFAGDLSVKDHLEQQITELLSKMILVSNLNRFDRLSSLFDQVLHERPMALLGVPRALLAEPRHHGDQPLQLR